MAIQGSYRLFAKENVVNRTLKMPGLNIHYYEVHL